MIIHRRNWNLRNIKEYVSVSHVTSKVPYPGLTGVNIHTFTSLRACSATRWLPASRQSRSERCRTHQLCGAGSAKLEVLPVQSVEYLFSRFTEQSIGGAASIYGRMPPPSQKKLLGLSQKQKRDQRGLQKQIDSRQLSPVAP